MAAFDDGASQFPAVAPPPLERPVTPRCIRTVIALKNSIRMWSREATWRDWLLGTPRAATWRDWLLGTPRAAVVGDVCAVCLEAVSKDGPSLQGSALCAHLFHEECLQQWGGSCPTCRRSPPDEAAAAAPTSVSAISAWSWSWLTLMVVPWPRASARTDEPWDPSRGIGDWRTRAEALYATEEEEASDSDEETPPAKDQPDPRPDSELTDAELLKRHPWLHDDDQQ